MEPSDKPKNRRVRAICIEGAILTFILEGLIYLSNRFITNAPSLWLVNLAAPYYVNFWLNGLDWPSSMPYFQIFRIAIPMLQIVMIAYIHAVVAYLANRILKSVEQPKTRVFIGFQLAMVLGLLMSRYEFVVKGAILLRYEIVICIIFGLVYVINRWIPKKMPA
jgi:hypothetical protein